MTSEEEAKLIVEGLKEIEVTWAEILDERMDGDPVIYLYVPLFKNPVRLDLYIFTAKDGKSITAEAADIFTVNSDNYNKALAAINNFNSKNPTLKAVLDNNGGVTIEGFSCVTPDSIKDVVQTIFYQFVLVDDYYQDLKQAME